MSWVEPIAKQLEKRYIPNYRKRISYYESIPLRQIQMDTSFFKLPLSNDTYPVLVIVDIATKYVKYYVQKAKNDRVVMFLERFMKEVKRKFKGNKFAKNTIVITDGAGEFNVLKKMENVEHFVSTSKNKAAVAEAAIARLRRVFRKDENRANIMNVRDRNNDNYYGDKNLQKLLNKLADELNENAKIKPPPNNKDDDIFYQVGTPVFVVNMSKFYPDQFKSIFEKKGYKQNWLMEPMWVTSYQKVQNIYKYTIESYISGEPEDYYYYSDQLQPIDDSYVSEYIIAYREYEHKRLIDEEK